MHLGGSPIFDTSHCPTCLAVFFRSLSASKQRHPVEGQKWGDPFSDMCFQKEAKRAGILFDSFSEPWFVTKELMHLD